MASKHPSGLYVLFFTEMWERFGFYLMLALFSLYLNEARGYSQAGSINMYKWYMTLVYLTPFFGGLFADRIFGYRKAVITGALLLAAGYFLFAINHPVAFYGALALLIFGNGLFKPNISTLVGNLYPQGDSRRDSAFSIFYMGINIGALFAGPVGEAVRQKLGWGLAFATAGLGMVLGLIVFLIFWRHLEIADQRSSVSAILDVPLGPEYEDRPDPPHVERQRIIALAITCGIVMLFWMSFHQNGSTLTFWARDRTQREVIILGHSFGSIPPGVFSSFNSLFVIFLTPLLVGFMARLRKLGWEPSTPGKIGIGMVLTAAAFGIMALAGLTGGDTSKVSMWWLISSYFVITVGELLVSPMGLSMVTKLAPRRMTAMLMGGWFISTSFGNWLSGQVGESLWEEWKHSAFFGLLTVSSLFAAFVLLTQLRRLRAAMPPEGPTEDSRPSDDSAQPAAVTAPLSSPASG